MPENFETLSQYSGDYKDPPEKVRIAARGIIVEDNKILLTHELNTGVFMSPGGGLEENETLEECCIREIREESGIEAKPIRQFLRINEYCPECLYVSNYFICEKLGECEQKLTETEIEHGVSPEWVDMNNAIAIFGEYEMYRRDIASLYLREFTVLNKYLEFTKK
ncbi:MAG: NUDIX domain-containing protein [Ruminococcaceae bacterium]|nr:NUDIX domain-containing protein [Oscillospiraceae bacterium]